MPTGGRVVQPHVATSVSDESVDSDAYVDLSIDTAHIAASQVTYAKIQNVSATNRILGRDSASAGDIEEISPSSLLTMLGVETAATADQTAGEVLTLIEDGVDSVHYVNNSVDAVHLFDLARGSILIGDGSAATVELTVGSDNYVLTVDSSGDIGWEAAGAVSGAQTGITTILNASTKIGRDTQNLVDFATTDNKIIFRVNNVDEVELVADALQPTTNNGVALGTTALGWSDVHIATGGVINWVNGQMTITETSADLLTIAGGAVSATAASLSFDSGVADENVSGITASFTAGEDLVRGEVVYFKASDSKMWKAVATGSGTMPVVAMAAADISADAAGLFLLQGFCRDDGTMPAYTVGGRLYAPEAETSSENVPEQAQPDSDGDFVQDLGFALTANILYFKPGETVVEIA